MLADFEHSSLPGSVDEFAVGYAMIRKTALRVAGTRAMERNDALNATVSEGATKEELKMIVGALPIRFRYVNYRV